MYKLALIILILLVSLFLKIGLQKLWISSNPGPYSVERIIPVTPEQHILTGRKIDINNAPKISLEVLPGIGPRLAERIIAKRDELGGFKRPENIMEVKGIGEAKFKKIRQFIDVK